MNHFFLNLFIIRFCIFSVLSEIKMGQTHRSILALNATSSPLFMNFESVEH